MTRMNFTIPGDIAARFRDYCKKEKLRMSAVVAQLVNVWLNKKELEASFGKKQERRS